MDRHGLVRNVTQSLGLVINTRIGITFVGIYLLLSVQVYLVRRTLLQT